jgi:hypothetical protein
LGRAAETVGVWIAAAVGIIAIIVGTHDSKEQRDVMSEQVTAMQDQLKEMRATAEQTSELKLRRGRLALVP